MAKTKNPFRLLGLDPQVIRTLNDNQIEILVQSAFKAMQNIYHPDKPGGSATKSKQINEARQLLDQQKNPEIYQALKTQFLRKKAVNKQVAECESKLKRALKQKTLLNQAFLNYLIKAANQESLTVFNLPACKLIMRDYGADVNISLETKEMSPKKMRQRIWDFLFYDLIVDDQGQLTKIHQGKTEQQPDKILIAAIDEVTVKKHISLINILRLTQPIQPPRSDSFLRLGEKPSRKEQEKEIIFFRNKIEPEAFSNLIHLLTPVIKVGSYLFSLRQTNKTLYFSLEGCIQEITLDNE